MDNIKFSKRVVRFIFGIFLFLSVSLTLPAQEHPSLILTKSGVAKVRSGLGSAPLFDKALAAAIAEVDAEIALGVQVPIPKDMAGGYTHQRHKQNFFILQLAGNLYQITEEEKYAQYIKECLMAYAKMYPTLPLHPTNKSYATGKIFWQCLNDANWLVYVSQAYDAIYNYLSAEERQYLEKDLFRPYADFLSIDNPKFFNRIHNHSTWANAAVGMIGLVMNDKVLVDRALYGMTQSELGLTSFDRNALDNDGGFIFEKGNLKAGFLAQLDKSFAPDGYFTEGPYYLRYAIFPYLIFSKALSNKKPELDILDYRDGILTKAIYTLLNQTDAKGEFFPLNDAQKGMSLKARELISAIDILYDYDPTKKSLLDIARYQDQVLIDETGYKVALALEQNEATPFVKKSTIYGDGEDGTEGGVAVLRNQNTALVMKFSAQGMGHGHYDKLSYSLYDATGEVIQDYGAARWVNVDQKDGGRYLKENKTFAKQSIAHNTVVINETSHYKGSIKIGELYHPYLYFSDLTDPDLQIISVKDTNAYNKTELHRSMILLTDKSFPNPLVIDIFRVAADAPQQVDLPLWFKGHLLNADFSYERSLNQMSTFGAKFGYQHIWQEAVGTTSNNNQSLTWFHNEKFYTYTMATESGDQIVLGKLGANDANFNLRNDPVSVHRKKTNGSTLFASVVESHGTYNRDTELPLSPFAAIKEVTIIKDEADFTVVQISDKSDNQWKIAISNKHPQKDKKHKLNINSEVLQWQGPYTIVKN